MKLSATAASCPIIIFDTVYTVMLAEDCKKNGGY
jgi:hypothetical protein